MERKRYDRFTTKLLKNHNAARTPTSTEVGTISKFLIQLLVENRPMNGNISTFQTAEDKPGMFEVFIHLEWPSPVHTIPITAGIHGKPAYATTDIVNQHPTKPTKYKVARRTDDIFNLSTGEKPNLFLHDY
ncbi:hypothetical protein BOTBODRAFT_56244 [Botryobasidium botryosum FD-172 SS1]|uniref:Uncharacterized protein n=1 Tax=Botryobasidium botryosum (strain FD-172 SS1) TaxID=930990 RepID=A0A067MC78_BOTB1|nr:hypothetical protein BOTBODRAFT_56244 [Botryobasidium botryosum FD-172 SS1]